MYVVELSQKTQKFLDKTDSDTKERIEKSLKRLKENPVPKNVKFIGRDKYDKIFRYRIGDYRALYVIKESEKIVLITKIDKRSRIDKR